MSNITFNSIGNNRVDISSIVAVQSDWQTIDLSVYVPEGATAAILEFRQTGSSTQGLSGVRHPNSSINTSNYQYTNSKLFLLAPLNESRQTSIRRTSSSISVFLHGWTGSGVTMLTNRVSLGTHVGDDTWDNIDLSGSCPEGTRAVIIEIFSSYPKSATGIFRHPDSTVGLTPYSSFTRYHSMNISAVNANREVAWGAASGEKNAYLVGYITSSEEEGFFIPVNMVNVTPGSADETLTHLLRHLPGGAEMAVVNLLGYNRIRKDSGYDGDYNNTSGYSSCIMSVTALRTLLITNASTTAYHSAYIAGASQVPYFFVTSTAPTGANIEAFRAYLEATITGSLSYLDEIDEWGFDYGETSGSYTDEVTNSGTLSSASFALWTNELIPSRWYFARPKIHHITLGWIYGTEFSFKSAHDDTLVLYEHQNTDDLGISSYGNTVRGMTFTPQASHIMRSFKLKFYKTGNPPSCILRIYNTSNNVPTGEPIFEYYYPMSKIGTSQAEHEVGLSLDQSLFLKAGVKYAIAVFNPSGNTSNRLNIRYRNSNVYPRGGWLFSGNGGASWSDGLDTNVDWWFEEFGDNGVETHDASNIKARQAQGNLLLTAPTDITHIGFEWGTSPGVYPNEVTEELDELLSGIYSLQMTSLSPSTPYYYRAKAYHTTYGWFYGEEKTFTTLDPIPTVRTLSPTDIQLTSYTGQGIIDDTGDSPTCDKVGFVYGLTSHSNPGNVSPDLSGYDSYTEDEDSYSVGEFSLPITGLTQNKIYRVRAYAHNADGYAYGGELVVYTNTDVNILFPNSDASIGIRFDSSPGSSINHPYAGTTPHWVLCLYEDSKWYTSPRWGYVSGNYIFEYHYYNSNMHTDIYGLSNPIKRSEGIVKIKWKARLFKNWYPYAKYRRQLRTHGITYAGTKRDISWAVDGRMVCEIFYTNPYTGSAWTIAELDELQAGISLGEAGGFGIAACDMLRVVVLWANAAIRTEVAQDIGGTIRLNSTVLEDEGEECSVYFQWGIDSVTENNTTLQTGKYKGDTVYADVPEIDPDVPFMFRAVIITDCGETFYGATRSFLMYPTDPITRVTSIIHRYNRGIYSMELGLGDVVAGLTIPQPDIVVKKSVEPTKEEQDEDKTPHVKPPVVFPPITNPDLFPASDKVTMPQSPPPEDKDSDYSTWDYFKMGLTPWNEPAGETWQSYQEEKGGFLPAVGGVLHHVGSTVWQTITPWKEEEGETFGSEISERWQSFTGFLGRLFK